MSFPPRFAGSPDFYEELRELLERSGEPQDLLDRPDPEEPVEARYETLPIPDRGELGLEYELLGGGRSFDLNVPYTPGRDLEGIPNVDNPAMREKILRRFGPKNPGGQELPGFLKKAVLPGEPYA
jgi:hypothetical protein